MCSRRSGHEKEKKTRKKKQINGGNKAKELADWLRTCNLKWKNLNLLAVYQCAFRSCSFSVISSGCAFVRIELCVLIIGFFALAFFCLRTMDLCVAQLDSTVAYRKIKEKMNHRMSMPEINNNHITL